METYHDTTASGDNHVILIYDITRHIQITIIMGIRNKIQMRERNPSNSQDCTPVLCVFKNDTPFLLIRRT